MPLTSTATAPQPRKLGKRTTADQALLGVPDQRGKIACVTGGNAGIGFQTCRSLALAGARVYLCARSEQRGHEAIEAIRREAVAAGRTADAVDVRLLRMDLSDLASVRAAAEQLLAELAAAGGGGSAGGDAGGGASGDAGGNGGNAGAGRGAGPGLHMLILNAGVVACPHARTAQGLESQTGVNHIAHFYFTQLLLPALKAHGGPARVVVVASKAHGTFGGLDVDDLNWEARTAAGKYGTWAAYGQSKLCNVLFARELAKRLQGTPVRAFSLHPGVIFTALETNIPLPLRMLMRLVLWPMAKSVQQGAATSVYAATAPELEAEGCSGAYLEDCGLGKPSAQGSDSELAGRLWAASEQLLAAALEGKVVAAAAAAGTAPGGGVAAAGTVPGKKAEAWN